MARIKNVAEIGVVDGPDPQDKKYTVSCPLCGWELDLMRSNPLHSVAAELSIPHVEWVAIGEDGKSPTSTPWEQTYNDHVDKHQPAEWLHLIKAIDAKQTSYYGAVRNLNEFLDSFAAWLDSNEGPRCDVSAALGRFVNADETGSRSDFIPEQFKNL